MNFPTLRLRTLLVLILLVVLGWSGWWVFAAGAQQKAYEAWLADRRSEGWLAEAGNISVTGYPFRFDTKVTELSLAEPAEGWAWHAPEFEVMALAYQPNHIIAAWPGDQRISTPQETVTVNGRTLRGSVRFQPSTALGLDQSTIEMDGVTARSSLGWEATLEHGVLAVRRAADGSAPQNSYDASLEARRLEIPDMLRGLIEDKGLLDPLLDHVSFDATLAFDSAWNRRSVEGRKPVLSAMVLRKADIQWGDLRFSARGRLKVNQLGQPEGELEITAENWKRMLQTAVEAGLVPRDLYGTLEAGLGVVAMLSGDPETLRAPLTFSGGQVRIGPVPLGATPVLDVPNAG
ncbi:DUF2125 domain-containing protein [Paroceanicella profunda]|uniref:DUF2125 domain-containing protein n=1 Tax=Paroceanicella profunda TaxID=2579971 RepID=A0A5B8FXQ0_9RHOB|nr:DUF2125 domain-containing protein [Paroceanicella profunda]QDL91329.1 DUF2125 domain-containing protein [Paroceanicella profunda]